MAWWHRPQATRIYPLRPDPTPTHPSQGLCLPTGKRNPRRTRGVKEGAWQGSRQRGWSRAGAAGGPTGRRARPRPGRVASAGLGAQALAGLTARGHTDVRVGVEEDVAVWTEAALRQRLVLRAVVPARPGRRPGTSVHADSVRGRKQRARTERGVVRGPRCPMGLGRRSGWGGAAQRSWAGGPGHFSKSPAGCSQTLWTPPPHPIPTICSPGVTGHGVHWAAWLVYLSRRAGEVWEHRDGSQVGRGGQSASVPQPRHSPHSPPVALRQSRHAPLARQSAA